MTTFPAGYFDAVREHGLVVIAGAGISMLPPALLPNWRDFNRAVLEALAERAGRETNPTFVAGRMASVVARREVERAYQPDFLAQLIEEEVGADYFRVLQALDGDVWNRNHAQLAALAAGGVLRAVVTTNFDRLIERAFADAGVAFRVFATPDAFDTLGAHLDTPDGAVPIVKAHGSVEQPESMVDTLAQRVRGRPASLNAAVAALLGRHAALAIGFSGADLDYDPEYLGLRRAKSEARSLLVLNRRGSAPLAAMRELVEAFGGRAAFADGSLPEALDDLAGATAVSAPRDVPAPAAGADELQARLGEHTRAWAAQLGPMQAINAFVALLDASGDDPWMLDFMLYFRRYYRSEVHTQDPVHGSPAYWRYEYQFGRRLLDRGRHTPDQHQRDNGQRLLSSQVISFRPYEDALNLLGGAAMRGNLPEAHVAMSELSFWVYGPGRAVAHAQQTWQRLAEAMDRGGTDGDRRRGVETCVGVSRVFEWAGEYPLALAASTAAIHDARFIGDEPRRAAALVQHGRSLACVGRQAEAEASLDEAARIAGRLSLERLRRDAQSAQGMLDVMRSRDGDAVEPLSIACAYYRRTGRLPRLFITLLDLTRAAFYTGTNDLLTRGQVELHELCDLFPRAEGLMILLKLELAQHNRAWEHVGPLTDALEAFCKADADHPWRWGLGRVQRHRKALDERGA